MDRKRKRTSGSNEADWTAARCQRLLRPIASRVAPLRNLAYITEGRRPEKDDTTKLGTTSISARQICLNVGESLNDPTWLHRPDTRSNLKSYSSKNRTTKREEKEDSLISLPTPFKARALRRSTPTKRMAVELTLTPCFKARTKFTKRQKKDPFSFAPVAMQSAELHDRQTFEKVFELHQGVVDGYSLLLQKTAERNPIPNKRGASSLFSTCLRKVPDYIHVEEDYRKSIDPDDETDVGAEVYEELEDFGSMSGHGWPPLREVVRAHGFKLVHDLIRDKLVSAKTRAELANLPLQHAETVDSERLVLALAHSLPLKRPFNNTSPLFDGCLASLEDADLFSKHSGSTGTRIRILDSLYSSGRLDSTWVATKDMSKSLSGAVRSLASLSHSEDARHIAHFLEAVIMHSLLARSVSTFSSDVRAIEQGGNREEPSKIAQTSSSLLEAAYNTVNSLLTVLTAMSIIESKQDGNQQSTQQERSRTAMNLVQSLATSILLQCQNGSEASRFRERRPVNAARIELSILTSALMSSPEQGLGSPGFVSISIEDIVSGITTISQSKSISQKVSEEMSSFICNLALCCGQSLSFDSQDVLEDLVQNLMTKSETVPALEKRFLQQLALETAIAFAALSSSRDARVFAKKLERTVSQHVSLPGVTKVVKQDHIQDANKRTGFRWEEGLCEWIAATPFSSRKARLSTRTEPQTSPLPIAIRGRRGHSFIASHEESSSFLDDSCAYLDDSGYMSMQETPKPSWKHDMASILASSPDVLNGQCQSGIPFRAVSRRSAALVGIRKVTSLPQADRNDDGKKDTVRSHNPSAEPIKQSAPLESSLSKLVEKSGPNSQNKPREVAKPQSTAQSLVSANDSSSGSRSQAQAKRSSTPKLARPAEIERSVTQDQRLVEMSKTTTPHGSSSKQTAHERIDSIDSNDADFDELAMSCRKKTHESSSTYAQALETKNKVTVARKTIVIGGRRVLNPAPRKKIMEESDDELG